MGARWDAGDAILANRQRSWVFKELMDRSRTSRSTGPKNAENVQQARPPLRRRRSHALAATQACLQKKLGAKSVIRVRVDSFLQPGRRLAGRVPSDGLAPMQEPRGCSACPGGRHQAEEAGKKCDKCQSGQFSTSYGNRDNDPTCRACPIGFYQPMEEQASCLPCSPGKFGNETRMLKCYRCAIGKMSSVTNATTCSGLWSRVLPKYARPSLLPSVHTGKSEST